MVVNSIKDLPSHLQEQVMNKLKKEDSGKIKKNKNYNIKTEKKEKAVSKYRNRKTTVNGIVFDSKKEAQRYEELLLMLKSGEISDLRLQVEFTLQEAYTTYIGQKVRAIRYKADFTYINNNNEKVVEDVKSKATKTRTYEIKKKLLIDKFGVRIIEI